MRQPEAHVVGRLKLVVHHRHGRDPSRSGGENLRVGAMGEREAWAGGERAGGALRHGAR